MNILKYDCGNIRISLIILCSILCYGAIHSQDVNNITIQAIPGMQYDLVRFPVKPNSQVKLVFKNRDNMEHNLLITKPGSREKVVQQASELSDKGPEMNYNPATPEIIYSIETLAPGEEKTLTFKAPAKEGIYPYVCTYPGHGWIMYGAMYVTNNELPPLESDVNIPKSRRTLNEDLSTLDDQNKMQSTDHPYELRAPYLYRIFMPFSGPASIAVRLPGELSYCWDTDKCVMRYAWKGGFLDNNPPWTTKGQAMSKLLGTIFFQENNLSPLKIEGSKEVKPRYKGYELLEGGYPEFHYTLDGADVFELAKADKECRGIVIQYRIPGLDENLSLNFSDKSKVRVISEKGQLIDNHVLSPSEGKCFFVLIEAPKTVVE